MTTETLVRYTQEELETLNFILPTQEEIDELVEDIEIVMSSNAQYDSSPGSGCICNLNNGPSCNSGT